jgi:DNA-directed RNA polymerase subunit RPC12/RpoP
MNHASEQGASYCCPECGADVAAPEGSPAVQCSQCGAQFFKPGEAEDGQAFELSDGSSESLAADRDAELSRLRIRQFAVLRRAVYRSRSYFFMGVIVCLAAVIDLIWTAIHLAITTRLRTGPSSWLLFVGCVVLVVPALWGTRYFAGRIGETNRELESSAREEPGAEPDFSSLSDGTQQVKNLEEMGSAGRSDARD